MYLTKRDKSHKCILVKYSESSKAYRLWDPSRRKIVISRDVLFDEYDEGIVPIVNVDAKGKEVKDETDEKSEEISVDVPSSSSSLKPLPKWYTQTIKDSKVENIDTSVGVQTRSKVNFALMSNVLNTDEPESFAEAKDASHWQLAMQEEYDSILKNDTWNLVKLPSDKKSIGYR
eukprot:Gb_13954 [translate_table: standard]